MGVNIVGTDGNGLYYAGGSACYSHDGEVLSESVDKGCVVTQVLDWQSLTKARAAFPVALDADSFSLPI